MYLAMERMRDLRKLELDRLRDCSLFIWYSHLYTTLLIVLTYH